MKKIYLILAIGLLSTRFAFAENTEVIGEVKYLLGSAQVISNKKSLKLAVGDKIFLGQKIHTEEKSVIRLSLITGEGAIQVGPNSEFEFSPKEKNVKVLNLIKGYVLSSLKKSITSASPIKYKVKANEVAMGVRGTTFFAKVEPDGNVFQCVCEGLVETTWPGGKKNFKSSHHDFHHIINVNGLGLEKAPMGSEHSDEEIAELKKLIE